MAVLREIFEKFKAPEIRLKCPFLFYVTEEERKREKEKREKKVEGRGHRLFPRCGKGRKRKRNLKHYEEFSLSQGSEMSQSTL